MRKPSTFLTLEAAERTCEPFNWTRIRNEPSQPLKAMKIDLLDLHLWDIIILAERIDVYA